MGGKAVKGALPGSAGWCAWWVILAAACNIAGWTLSAFRAVGPLALFGAIAALMVLLGYLCRPGPPDLRVWKCLWPRRGRVQPALPLIFLAVAVVSAIGGLLHAPNNYDALNFRLPKVAGWLVNGGWEWIPAINHSLNTRACGMEWVMAAVIAWTGSDRALFLLNQLPFLLLPGLVFGVFRKFGAGRRSSRFWMWVLPTGYGFALQAGGIANDLPAAVFALAAFDSGLRWKHSGRSGDAFLALLAVGMMTAVKPTTLPLILPFTIMFIRMSRLLWRQPLKVAAAIPAVALASFLPNAVLNHWHCGDWTGAAAENEALGKVVPWVGLAGNLINAPLQNLAPPVLPVADVWNARVTGWFPESFLKRMAENFEARGARFGLTDLQGEETAGLGTGICLLVISGLTAGGWRGMTMHGWKRRAGWFALGFGIPLLAYFSRAGMTTVARHILPYYAFLLLPLVMLPPLQAAVGKRWFRAIAGLAGISTLSLLLITPSRPVLPMMWICGKIAACHTSMAVNRLAQGYRVYAERADLLGPLREVLPDNARTVGWINHAAGPEASLWKPYDGRRVVHFPAGVDPPLDSGPLYLVLNTRHFEQARSESPQRWLERLGGILLHRQEIRPLLKEGPTEWWVVLLPEKAAP